MVEKIPGDIITFYSYKGGTGRTMALANVACLLARRDRENPGNILMIDWDLEAPGLHRYFQKRMRSTNEVDFDTHPGLIDLFKAFEDALNDLDLDEEPERDEIEALFKRVDPARYIMRTAIPQLHLLKAGGQLSNGYASRVTNFQWNTFFDRVPWFFSVFAGWLSTHYEYTLIDSRTGISDTSGICTTLLPDKLVVVFTPNHQSLTGVIENLIPKVMNYRYNQTDDLRPLVVYPLPSRIEVAEQTLRQIWRFGDKRLGISGYQPSFESLFKDIHKLPECNLQPYFDEVQIQHIPHYAYGEEIAVLEEGSSDSLSLTKAYDTLTERLINTQTPWESKISLLREGDLIEGDKKLDSGYVYFSYTRSDLKLVQSLKDGLRRNGLNVWAGEESLEPGTRSWQRVIEGVIENAACIVVILSREGVNSKWILREIEYADAMKVTVIPFVVSDGLDYKMLPARLRRSNIIDAKDGNEQAFSKLLATVWNLVISK